MVRPGARSRRFPRFGGQRDERGVGEQPPAAHLAGRRGQDDGDDAAAEQLHGARGEPARAAAPGDGPGTPVVLGAEEVVDKPEEREGEAGEQHHRAQEAVAQLLPHPELGQRRPRRLDHQHGQDDDDARPPSPARDLDSSAAAARVPPAPGRGPLEQQAPPRRRPRGAGPGSCPTHQTGTGSPTGTGGGLRRQGRGAGHLGP